MSKELPELNIKDKWNKYKDCRWWIYLVLAVFFALALMIGLIYSCLIEYWYLENNNTAKFVSLQNLDILLAYFSVQVNLITVIWLFILISKKTKNNLIRTLFFKVILNLNLIVFTIFWAGIFYQIKNISTIISYYDKSQIVCTLITHFICPVFIFIMFCFEPKNEKIKVKDFFQGKDFWITYAYLWFYLFYVLIRSQIYASHLNVLYKEYKWPYKFMDLDNPFINGLNSTQYLFVMIGIFSIWVGVNYSFIYLIDKAKCLIQNKKVKVNQ